MCFATSKVPTVAILDEIIPVPTIFLGHHLNLYSRVISTSDLEFMKERFGFTNTSLKSNSVCSYIFMINPFLF